MCERQGVVTFKGTPLTLVGAAPSVGAEAPDAVLLATDLTEVSLAEYGGKVLVLASVPSLDTSVCDTEVRTFNQRAVELGEDVAVLAVSMDLPFAQRRWCGAAGVENVRTLSDHRDAAFGKAYGVLIKELRLLARAVFVVDRAGAVRHVQIVKEMTDQPDYAAVIEAVQSLV